MNRLTNTSNIDVRIFIINFHSEFKKVPSLCKHLIFPFGIVLLFLLYEYIEC